MLYDILINELKCPAGNSKSISFSFVIYKKYLNQNSCIYKADVHMWFCWREQLYCCSLYDPIMGPPTFESIVSKNRLQFFYTCISFDGYDTREQR